jgi:uncharacterized protein YjiS (DUF1127 family)
MTARTVPPLVTAPTDAFARLAEAVVAKARAVDAWLAARRRASQDRDDLASMSDRELCDIGLNRASVDAAATGSWSRDPFAP